MSQGRNDASGLAVAEPNGLGSLRQISRRASTGPVRQDLEFAESPADALRVVLGGSRVDLATRADAVAMILDAARNPGVTPLGVVSANLDHVHHFGSGGRWHGVLEQSEALGQIRWLTLLDGAPLVSQAVRLTGRTWPRLAGSDIIDGILQGAAVDGLSVGFLGGSAETHAMLKGRLRETHPALELADCWSPAREALADPERSGQIADEIRAAGVDVLVVCLGKPRQELWMAEFGARSGASVLLAFGAVVDFLAGRVARAPEWAARKGLEWSYRLAQEPRRLYRRYLVDGPEAYVRLRQRSRAQPSGPPPPGEVADLTVVVVGAPAGNGMDSDELRAVVQPLTARLVQVCAAPSPEALDMLVRRAGPSRGVLVVRAGVELAVGAVSTLWERLWQDDVGAVVPVTRDLAGRTLQTLRFVPTWSRRSGDLVFGDRFAQRPAWLTVVDRDGESYEHPHPVQGTSDDCVLLRCEVVRQIAVGAEGRRPAPAGLASLTRSVGWMTWFEPTAAAFSRTSGER